LKYGDFGAFFFPPPKTNPLLQDVVPFSFGRQVAIFRHKIVIIIIIIILNNNNNKLLDGIESFCDCGF